MRFPSLADASAHAFATLRRFPATLISALAACGLALVLVDQGRSEGAEALVRGLLTALLGISVFFAVEAAGERDSRGHLRLLGSIAGGAGLLALWIASARFSDAHLSERFGQLLVAAHLLAAFAAFLGTSEENGFWQFNRALFLRFATATLYTGVLFAGLAVALVSINTLFPVDIEPEAYVRLWIVLALGVHPWVFLAGVPRDIAALEQEQRYPPGLKIFAQFILIPLVSVYLAILTAYLVRVMVTGEWPRGWIGWLVSSVSAVGTLALLLVHPVRDNAGNQWVRGYARWFWVALMPSIIMLFFAIGQRIAQYGVTERRYFVLVLAIWIAVVAVRFAITRSKRIRFVPVSLAAIALLTSFGPWGAYSTARRSQLDRLQQVLEAAGASAFPVTSAATLQASPETARQLSDIVRYLSTTHSVGAARALLDPPIAQDSIPAGARGQAAQHARAVVEALGMRYYQPWEMNGIQDSWISLAPASDLWPAPTEVYQHFVQVYLNADWTQSWSIADRRIEMALDSTTLDLAFTLDDVEQLRLPLLPLLDALETGALPRNSPPDPDQLVLAGISAGLRVRVHVLQLDANRISDTYQNVNTNLALFFSVLPDAGTP